ncbi:MAG: 30S ribosomal protein S9 [Spirochaetota bacterium]
MADNNWVFAVGRRKTSIARIMVRKGEGTISINNKKPEEYFPTKNQVIVINQPLEATDNKDNWEFRINVEGGGFAGQAGATQHGIARALVAADPDAKTALRKGGFLTRDSRMVERKKAGQPKARKKFQFSKR